MILLLGLIKSVEQNWSVIDAKIMEDQKKRIFISMHYLELGGAEMSLIGLLNSFDYSKYSVDLFLYAHRGELMQFIPESVNLLPENSVYSMYEKPFLEVIKRGYWKIALARLIAKCKYKWYCWRNKPAELSAVFSYVMREVIRFLPSLTIYGDYDLAISFLTPHYVVLEKVLAKKKVAWIHTDYSRIDVAVEEELLVWEKYDHIVSISQDVTRSFIQVFPSLKDKIVHISNILSSSFVKTRAAVVDGKLIRKEMPKEDEDLVNILSVGRFYLPKRFEMIATIVRHLREEYALNIRWYIIGYGIMEPEIKESILNEKMEDYVIMLGKRANPYPYIKACDIYIQPSRWEGNSVTVREAQILEKPVVITNYPTAASQVVNGKDGVIVPMDLDSAITEIASFIMDKSLQCRLVDYLRNHDFSNVSEVYKVYDLMDE